MKFLLSFNPNAPWDEARVLVGLEGEHILEVRNAHHHLGQPFIVTPVADHGTVADQITPDVGVPTDAAITWIQHACRGTSRLHDRGLLHNDIKPDNIFLTANRRAILGDLGLAGLRDTTGHAPFAGTPATMAPEVARVGATLPQADWFTQRPCSTASDVYSLGASLYWLLYGRPPYEGATLVDTMQAVIAGPPPDLLDVAPHVPQGVRDIIRRAMDPDAAKRHHSPAAFDQALGSRARQPRTWTRHTPHQGHMTCFVGNGSSKNDLSVCVVPIGPKTTCQVQMTHVNSGPRGTAFEAGSAFSGATHPALSFP